MSLNLARASTTFALRLLQALHPAGSAKNVFFSPYSLHAALSMTANGARRGTLQVMKNGLGLPFASRKEMNSAHAGLRQALLADSSATTRLATANSLWLAQGLALAPGFAERCAADYAATAEQIDFSAPQAAEQMNAWVSQATEGLIERLLSASDLQPPPLLSLLNALYFKGDWAAPFDPQRTTPAEFHPSPDTTRPIKLMQRSGRYAYAQVEGAQIVSLPYIGEAFSCEIVLPAAEQPLAALLHGLDTPRWQSWLRALQSTQLSLGLPRLKLSAQAGLSAPLSAIGMARAFAPGADFSDLTDGPLFIGQVRHKAVLEVNESGSEAAAASAVLMLRTSAARPPLRMVVDRPFLCAIRHRPSGCLLFIAAVYDPTEDNS